MELEKRTVKGSRKKNIRQSDKKEVVKCSRYITLGVNSIFNVNDEVVIISIDDYKQLNNVTADNNTINNLNDIINNKDAEIKELTNKLEALQNTNDELTSEIAMLNNEVDKYSAYNIAELLQKANRLDTYTRLNKVQDEAIKEYKDIVRYYKDYIQELKSRGLFGRIRNIDVASNIDEPPLKFIDLNGYDVYKLTDDYKNMLIDYNNQSE